RAAHRPGARASDGGQRGQARPVRGSGRHVALLVSEAPARSRERREHVSRRPAEPGDAPHDGHRSRQRVPAPGSADLRLRLSPVAPPAYDIASLLWDPYYRLDDRMRERLLAYYLDQMKADRLREFDEKSFLDSLVACRLQRHMQALGAYGFLSEVKGKKYFLK